MFNQFISFLENDTLYSTPKLSDLHALSQRKQLENHTLQGGTYLHSPYLAVPPPSFAHIEREILRGETSLFPFSLINND